MTQRVGETYDAFRARVNETARARNAEVRLHRTVQFDAEGQAKGQSIKYVPERLPYEPRDDMFLKGRSTLVDAEGRVIQSWEKEQVDAETRRQAFEDWLHGLQTPEVDPIPWSGQTSTDDLMTIYPVGDHHMGMLSWKHETGESYDLDIAERLLAGAIDQLVASSPPSRSATIITLGDFLHFDSHKAETPTNKNALDTDTRYAKLIDCAARSLERMINTVLTKHQEVRLVCESGNHDPVGTNWMAQIFHMLYRDNPRITIDRSPSKFHYFPFGKWLFGTHHGDTVKMDKLPMIMAADEPEAWGASVKRMWLTGHIHQRKCEDFPGCSVESFRVLCPPDAWSHQMGYRNRREMTALVVHRSGVEVGRLNFSPKMLEASHDDPPAA